MGLICKNCGNSKSFMRTNVVVEVALYDGDGEFVRVLDADTKDSYGEACYRCGSRDLEDREDDDVAATG